MSASGAAAGSPPGGTTSFTNPHATRFDLGDMGRSAPSAVAHGFGSMLFRGPQPKAGGSGGGVRSTSAESGSGGGAKRGKGGKGRANGKASASAAGGEEESQDDDEDEDGSGAEEEAQQQQQQQGNSSSSSKAPGAKGKGKRAPAASRKKGAGSAGAGAGAGSGSAPPSADKQMAYALTSSGAPGAPAPMQRKHSGRAASRKGKEKDQEMDDSDGDESAMGDGHQQGNAAGGKAQQQQQVSFEGLDASSQRKAQNRIAQREFRQRKQEYIRALECRVELLSSEHDVQVDRLRWLLRQLLVENNQLRAVLGLLSSFVGDRGMGGFLGNNPETREELTQLLTTTSEKTITDAWRELFLPLDPWHTWHQHPARAFLGLLLVMIS